MKKTTPKCAKCAPMQPVVHRVYMLVNDTTGTAAGYRHYAPRWYFATEREAMMSRAKGESVRECVLTIKEIAP